MVSSINIYCEVMHLSQKKEANTMSDTGVTIRKAITADAGHILAVQKNAFQRYVGPLTPAQIPPLNELLEAVQKDIVVKSVLVANCGKTLAGSVRFTIKSGVCMIERLSVDPRSQGKGIGRALMETVEKMACGHAHKLQLETGLLEGHLIGFYVRLGYTAEAILHRHYGGFDWIVLTKPSNAEPDIPCRDLDEVRRHIDALDLVTVRLLAERGRCVRQAARFKNSAAGVRGEARIEAVVQKVREHAQADDVDPDMIERVYRTMIDFFVRAEMKEYTHISGKRAGYHA